MVFNKSTWPVERDDWKNHGRRLLEKSLNYFVIVLSRLFIGFSTVIRKLVWKRHGCEILHYLDFDRFKRWDVGEINEWNVITTDWVRDDSKVEKCVVSSLFVSLVKWCSTAWPLPACSQRSGSQHCQSVPPAFIATFRYNRWSSIYLFRVACQGVKVDPHTRHLQFPVQELKCISAGANWNVFCRC